MLNIILQINEADLTTDSKIKNISVINDYR